MKTTPKMMLALASILACGLQACAVDTTTSSDTQDATEININADPKNGGEVELYRSDADGQFYWRLKAANGEIILRGEGYRSLGGARNATQSLKRNAQAAVSYELRKANNGERYFVVKAANGRHPRHQRDLRSRFQRQERGRDGSRLHARRGDGRLLVRPVRLRDVHR